MDRNAGPYPTDAKCPSARQTTDASGRPESREEPETWGAVALGQRVPWDARLEAGGRPLEDRQHEIPMPKRTQIDLQESVCCNVGISPSAGSDRRPLSHVTHREFWFREI
jgi:hypothetical protein